ncbi:hypothetical protein CKO28_02340 [Rhodovibrio sodomensis]|uniref:Secreted protein n=1 Tax=Rhodovibrio sodomensis TaxID=1088 RepID=A0ABS1DA88_9PROT|nr:hypothetical protein [Rhodovibrio sodomensis]
MPLRRLLPRAALLSAAVLPGVLPLALTAADRSVTAPPRADSAVAAAPADRPAPFDVPQPAVKPPAPAIAGVCRGQRFIRQRVACLSDRAVQAGDPTVCFEAPDPDTRWPCVAKYAVVAGGPETCRLLPGPPADGAAADAIAGGDATVTVDLCLSTLALVYRRPELCRQLATEPMDDACLAKLVTNGADPALCRQVKSPDLRQVCRPDPRAEVAE